MFKVLEVSRSSYYAWLKEYNGKRHRHAEELKYKIIALIPRTIVARKGFATFILPLNCFFIRIGKYKLSFFVYFVYQTTAILKQKTAQISQFERFV